MNYVKKMCILRQVKQGFSGDGKTLSGLIKVEQYGKNLAVEVSIINFAPLVSGEYYCLLSDGKGRTETLALRGKSLFNILSDLDVSNGFCGVICYVKNEVVPVAYGINGNGAYDWRSILNATMPPVFPRKREETAIAETDTDIQTPTPTAQVSLSQEVSPTLMQVSPDDGQTEAESGYDDETVATENYYGEQEDGQSVFQETESNARIKGTAQKQNEKTGADLSENGDAAGVLHAFTTQSDGYYAAVKSEIDDLMKTYPRDDTLKGAFSCGEWVRVRGEEGAPEYLVGVVFEEGKAKYICYALAAQDKNSPPEEIKSVCTFVPASVYEENAGFFVIFQSAATGECIKPEKI